MAWVTLEPMAEDWRLHFREAAMRKAAPQEGAEDSALMPNDSTAPSRPGDDLIGCCGEDEIHTALLIGAQSGGKVEVSEQNFLGPISVGPIGAGGVQRRTNNGIADNFLMPAITKDKHDRRKLALLRGSGSLAGGQQRLIDPATGEAHKTIALKLNEQRIGRFHFFGRSWRGRLHGQGGGRRLGRRLISVIGVRVIPPICSAPIREAEAVLVETMSRKGVPADYPPASWIHPETPVASKSTFARLPVRLGWTGHKSTTRVRTTRDTPAHALGEQ